MNIAGRLADELIAESATTRRHFERITDSHLGWRPHEKSMSLGELAMHIALLPYAITELVRELETELPDVPRSQPEVAAELVQVLDRNVSHASHQIRAWGDAELGRIWTMKRGDAVLLQMPREAVIRSILLNHSYHHRGQLTVYLRLLGVSLPSTYGPSADEALF